MIAPSLPDHTTRDVRSTEPFDAGLSLLYRDGGTLTVDRQSYPDFHSAMVAVLVLDDARLPAIAQQISDGLRQRVRVTCELDRGLWNWMRSANGNS